MTICLRMGYDVLCLDNLLTGNTDNIAHLAGNPKFKFIKHDVTEYMFVEGRSTRSCISHRPRRRWITWRSRFRR